MRTLSHNFSSFIHRTSKLWNNFSVLSFHASCNLSSFKKTINKLDLIFLLSLLFSSIVEDFRWYDRVFPQHLSDTAYAVAFTLGCQLLRKQDFVDSWYSFQRLIFLRDENCPSLHCWLREDYYLPYEMPFFKSWQPEVKNTWFYMIADATPHKVLQWGKLIPHSGKNRHIINK